MNWYPVFLKEMLLFKRRFLRLGYFFSAMFAPLLYLVAFGLGLGRRIDIAGGSYLDFLLPGLVAMSSMTNSYTWIASGITIGKIHFKTFQVYLQAPVSPSSIMLGEVFAGMVRGLFASTVLIILGTILGGRFVPSLLFIVTLLLNCFTFASLGVVAGMKAKSHEDTATFSNFFILPMAFFSGTFFPVDEMPYLLKGIIYLLPLTHTNQLMRMEAFSAQAFLSLSVLCGTAIVLFGIGSMLIKRYSE